MLNPRLYATPYKNAKLSVKGLQGIEFIPCDRVRILSNSSSTDDEMWDYAFFSISTDQQLQQEQKEGKVAS